MIECIIILFGGLFVIMGISFSFGVYLENQKKKTRIYDEFMRYTKDLSYDRKCTDSVDICDCFIRCDSSFWRI